MTQTRFNNMTKNQVLIFEKLGRMIEDKDKKIVLIFKKYGRFQKQLASQPDVNPQQNSKTVYQIVCEHLEKNVTPTTTGIQYKQSRPIQYISCTSFSLLKALLDRNSKEMKTQLILIPAIEKIPLQVQWLKGQKAGYIIAQFYQLA